MKPCLRSIRKHSSKYELEIIVIDNGSRDDSLDYLRSLSWIKLIERPEETPRNWPKNVFTAWDLGLQEATGDYYVTMHSDVFIKADNWLDPFLRDINITPDTAASGSWKLELRHPLYAWQKRVLGGTLKRIKRFLGRKTKLDEEAGRYPRDYCAMYKTAFLKANSITFYRDEMPITGGHQVALQIWAHGGKTRVFPVAEMGRCLAHIAHGTSAITTEINLRKKSEQSKTNQRKVNLFRESWIQALIDDRSLDC